MTREQIIEALKGTDRFTAEEVSVALPKADEGGEYIFKVDRYFHWLSGRNRKWHWSGMRIPDRAWHLFDTI